MPQKCIPLLGCGIFLCLLCCLPGHCLMFFCRTCPVVILLERAPFLNKTLTLPLYYQHFSRHLDDVV